MPFPTTLRDGRLLCLSIACYFLLLFLSYRWRSEALLSLLLSHSLPLPFIIRFGLRTGFNECNVGGHRVEPNARACTPNRSLHNWFSNELSYRIGGANRTQLAPSVC